VNLKKERPKSVTFERVHAIDIKSGTQTAINIYNDKDSKA